MEISQTALFLGSIIDLYCLVLILRVWLPLANVDYYNPISQFTLKLTQPVIAPLRKVFPVVKKVETTALVLVFLLCGLKSVLFGGLNLNYFLLLGILGLIKNIGVAAVPGSSFFREEVNHLIRLHFAREEKTLDEALVRLEKLKELL